MPEAPSIQFTRTPLDIAAALQAVNTPDAGGIDIFLGTTRAESHPDAGSLLRLDYDAYEEMALAQMHKLADRAHQRWPITRLVLWHRLGPVAVGEPSVIIAVSCPHRSEAFDACRFLIDELKKDVPIWKKEVYENQARWQGEGK